MQTYIYYEFYTHCGAQLYDTILYYLFIESLENYASVIFCMDRLHLFVGFVCTHSSSWPVWLIISYDRLALRWRRSFACHNEILIYMTIWQEIMKTKFESSSLLIFCWIPSCDGLTIFNKLYILVVLSLSYLCLCECMHVCM